MAAAVAHFLPYHRRDLGPEQLDHAHHVHIIVGIMLRALSNDFLRLVGL